MADDAGIDLGHGSIYEWAASRRPFVHPLKTKRGHTLTVDAPDDHPWHHGLWFTIKFVNGDNFWEEYDTYGVLRHRGRPTVVLDGAVTGEIEWIAPDRETVVIDESRTWHTSNIDETTYAVDFSTTLVPIVDVTLDRTPFTTWGGYGGLALRGRADWHDTRLLTADGLSHDRVLGDPFRWCSLGGPVADIGDDASITILDHPRNPNHPTPWYASTRADTYGDEGWSNFCNAAFLWDGPMEVGANEALHFSYRILVSDRLGDRVWIEEQYEHWAG